MVDPALGELRKSIQEAHDHWEELDTIYNILTKSPKVLTEVSRAFRRPTLQKERFLADVGAPLDSPHLPAILKVFNDSPGKWITAPEIEARTNIGRSVIRAVMLSAHHRDLFERAFQGRRLLWRLKGSQETSGPAPTGPAVREPSSNGRAKAHGRQDAQAGKESKKPDKGEKQKADRPLGRPNVKSD